MSHLVQDWFKKCSVFLYSGRNFSSAHSINRPVLLSISAHSIRFMLVAVSTWIFSFSVSTWHSSETKFNVSSVACHRIENNWTCYTKYKSNFCPRVCFLSDERKGVGQDLFRFMWLVEGTVDLTVFPVEWVFIKRLHWETPM